MSTRVRPPRRLATVGLAAAVVSIAGGGTALAAGAFGDVDSTGAINACVNTTNGQTRVVTSPADCKKGEQAISWKQRGDKGDKGEQGDVGPKGEPGAVGPQG